MKNNTIVQINIDDDGLSLDVNFDYNLNYFNQDAELAKKVIKATVECFRNQMAVSGLIVPADDAVLQ